jgi:hypothetical protein
MLLITNTLLVLQLEGIPVIHMLAQWSGMRTVTVNGPTGSSLTVFLDSRLGYFLKMSINGGSLRKKGSGGETLIP